MIQSKITMSFGVSLAPGFPGWKPCALPQTHAGASDQRDDASKMHVGGRATAATPASAAASMVTRSLKFPAELAPASPARYESYLSECELEPITPEVVVSAKENPLTTERMGYVKICARSGYNQGARAQTRRQR
jgi:hypothetical protein